MKCILGNHSEPSIYQRENAEAHGERPRFTGFFRVFGEGNSKAVAGSVYMLWFTIAVFLQVVHTRQGMEGITGNHNQSTRDGTKVVVRAAGTGMEEAKNAEKSGRKSDC